MTKQDKQLWLKEMRKNNYDIIVIIAFISLLISAYNAFKQDDAIFLIGTGISLSIIIITLILSYKNRFDQL